MTMMVLLSACGQQPAQAPFADATDEAKISCRIGDATNFAPVCAVERLSGPDGLVLTLRHPDGGFRRLLVTKDGRGVVAADGAEKAKVAVTGDKGIEVTLGGDAYRLPATVKRP